MLIFSFQPTISTDTSGGRWLWDENQSSAYWSKVAIGTDLILIFNLTNALPQIEEWQWRLRLAAKRKRNHLITQIVPYSSCGKISRIHWISLIASERIWTVISAWFVALCKIIVEKSVKFDTFVSRKRQIELWRARMIAKAEKEK